jgi:CRP-like cAMP-binding protein
MRENAGETARAASHLAGISLFDGVPADALLRLERAATAMTYRDGTEIFIQGDPADCLYAITGGDGAVRVGATSRRSQGLMVEKFRAGDVFGEVGALDRQPRTATAIAEGQVRTLRISATAFDEALSEVPLLGANLARVLSHRLRRTFELFQDAAFERLEVRLARQLLYLANLNSRETDAGVKILDRMRQGDLADLLGATNRTIITILNDWRTTGLVEYDTDTRFVTVRDVARMKALVETGE